MKCNLDYPVFPQERLDRLFEYILLDDVPHFEAELDYNFEDTITSEEIELSYKLCWQLLKRNTDFKAFRRLILKLAVKGCATEEERLFFKYVRARFKHMRFAYTNFDKCHQLPGFFHSAIVTMGKMQDSFKNGQRFLTLKYGMTLLLFLSPLFQASMERELKAFRADTPEGIRTFHKKEIEKLKAAFENKEQMTAHSFHAMRKIFSRWVSFNDTLRTVRPSAQLDQFSAYLATINGMMGDCHDEYVEKKFQNKVGYFQDNIRIPEEVLKRIRKFLNKAH